MGCGAGKHALLPRGGTASQRRIEEDCREPHQGEQRTNCNSANPEGDAGVPTNPMEEECKEPHQVKQRTNCNSANPEEDAGVPTNPMEEEYKEPHQGEQRTNCNYANPEEDAGSSFSVPEFICPTLRLGHSFNARKSSPGINLFENVAELELQNISKYFFNYKVVNNSSDVKDLLDISGDLSIKIKAGLLKVSGAGRYLNDIGNKEDVTEVVAMMKCTTVCEAIDDGKSKVKGNLATYPNSSIGTHYVRSVTYGGEMLASLKFKSLTGTKSNTLRGEVEGKVSELMVSDGRLKAHLDKLASECTNQSDIEIKYYGTVKPEKLPTNFDDLVQLIENFPRQMSETGKGHGVPIKFELQPIQNLGIRKGTLYLKKDAIEASLKDFEDRYDDLRRCREKLKKYFSEADHVAKEIVELNKSVKAVLKVFHKAIQELNLAGDENQLEASEEAYNEALGGIPRDGKFMAEWRKSMEREKHKLKPGEDLTVVLFGKTGNGKSATANQIVGDQHFDESDSAASVTRLSNYFKRKGDRGIRVIDTPGIMDTSSIPELKKASSHLAVFTKQTKATLNAMAKVFQMAPDGFHAILLIAKYGCRFTQEDSEALQMLLKFLGEESIANMILVLTHADQAARSAKKKKVSVEKVLDDWLKFLPKCVQEFIQQINNRIVLFDNTLEADARSQAQVEQVEKLAYTIDIMMEGREPFVNKLTKASKKELNQQIKKTLEASGIVKELKQLKKKEEELKAKQKLDAKSKEAERKRIQQQMEELEEQKRIMAEKEKEKKAEEASNSNTEENTSGWCSIL